jgi:hypothetical protein
MRWEESCYTAIATEIDPIAQITWSRWYISVIGVRSDGRLILMGESEVVGETKLRHCYFVHHKFHMEIKPVSTR